MPPSIVSTSIPIRYDCKGNDAVDTMSVEEVKKSWKVKNCYEIAFTSDEDLVILFGDIDVKTPDMPEVEFENLNNAYKNSIKEFIGDHIYAIASASSYKAKKISWRFYVPDMVGTASAQKTFAEEVNKKQGIKLEDGTPVLLDLAVYHKGRKLRMLHAWKQTKNNDGKLEDDPKKWENRPLVIVEGLEEDTMLHRIMETAERIPSPKVPKKLAYDDFDIIRKLVLECLDEARAKDYLNWSRTIWAIKTTENSERGKELAHDFSKRSSSYDSRSVERVWKDGKDKISGASIHYWARQDNPVKYAELVCKLPVEFLETHINNGDIGLSKIFVEVYKETIVSPKNTSRRSYYAFNHLSGLWDEQKDDYIITAFTSYMRDILYPLVLKLTSDYKQVADNDEGKVLKKKIDNVLNLIKSCSNTKTASKCIPQISILLAKPENWAGETLNKARDILPVMNGVLELRTGNLRPYEMEDYLTYKIPIDYNPKASTDNQQKFFNDVLHNDHEAIKYIHYFLGYCLTGETSLQKALILEGSEDGANGKSVLMDCMLAILGKDLYSTLNRKAITLTEGQNNDSLYDARFSRIVCIPEMNKNGNNIDEGLIKNITGDDEVNVSAKFKNNIRFHPQFKVCMPLNEMFAVPASSGAVWRRLIVMPFKVRFLSKDNPDWDDELAEQKLIIERDDKFAKELKIDKEGWLNWLVQGSIQFYTNPDQEPPRSLQEHMIKIQEENDSYLSYINNAYKITGDKKDYILVNDMTKDYPNVEKDKEKVIQRRIGVAMKKLNIVKGTKDIYPVKRESSCEGGRWLSKEIEDTSLPSTKMKVWFGLRKKTEEDRQED